MAENSAKRIDYIDIMKGIGMLSVIAGHYGDDRIERVVFVYHLPLFFLISGYFLSTKKSFAVYWREKVKQLLPPYLFTCVCLIVISVINNLHYDAKQNIVHDILLWTKAALYGAGGDFQTLFYIKGIGAIWFILATLWSLLLVRYCVDMKYAGAIVIAAIAYVSYATSAYFWMPFSLQAAGTAALFVYAGYLLRKVDFLNQKFHIGIFVFALCLFVFQVYFHIAPYMYKNYYPNGMLGVIGAITACYLVLWLSRFIERWMGGLGAILKFFGKNSMIIMCVHLMELSTFVWHRTWDSFQTMSGIQRWGAYLVVFAAKLLIYSVGVWIVYQVPFLRKIFGVTKKK